MDQDELEDEIFTKTIGTHLTMLSEYINQYSLDLSSLFMITHRREFFIYSVAVILAILGWLIHSGVLSKRFELFDSISRGIGSLEDRVWQETDQSGSASGNVMIVQRNKSTLAIDNK